MTKAIQRLFCLSVLLLFAVVPTTFAGDKEFIAAMGKQDYKSAAAETGAIWNAFDKSKPAAVTLAREFAYVNYMAGNLDKAKTFIGYLTAGENRLVTPDNQADTTSLLASLIDYRADDNDQQRDKLVHSIERRLQRADTDVISIIGTEYLYLHDWEQHKWNKVQDSAKYAIELLTRSLPKTLVRLRYAEATIAAAAFLDDKEDMQHYNGLVDLHDTVVGDVDQMQDLQIRDSLIKLKWLLHAWIQNAEALYTKFDWKLEHPVANFKPRSLKYSEKGYFYEQAGASNDLPVCEYTLNTKRVFLPRSNDYRAQVGTVLFKMDVDENGKVSNAIALSSVPEDRYQMMMGFSANNIKMMRAKGQSKDSCRLNQKNAIVPVSFEIEKEERIRR